MSPSPAYVDDRVTVLHGDCLDVLATLPADSVDAVVTDPPYGLGFMGKEWDGLPPGREWAEACMRVLKPGGHLLAFGGSRTWHRLAVAIEDAGFELRDSIAWLYGSGFPKSLDVSKAVDKLDAAAERRARALEFTAWMRSTGITSTQINDVTGTNMGGHYLTAAAQPCVATADLFDQLRPMLPAVPDRIEQLVAERTVESQNYAARKVTGQYEHAAPGQTWSANYGLPANPVARERRDTAHTAEAAAWAGWGTALKPAFEPVVVARKPMGNAVTVAANVRKHGTGALNIDGCRVAAEGGSPSQARRELAARTGASPAGGAIMADRTSPERYAEPRAGEAAGRWPTNVLFTHAAGCEQVGTVTEQVWNHRAGNGDPVGLGKADTMGAYRPGDASTKPVASPVWACVEGCPVGELDAQAPKTGAAAPASGPTHAGASERGSMAGHFTGMGDRAPAFHGDRGGASRFFPVFRYQAKAPQAERPKVDGVAHPTVKPLELMRWLIRLVTPPGGVVLEPFAGSGTTVEAALLEGVRCVAIEREADYLPLIAARIARQAPAVDDVDDELALFEAPAA